MRSHKRLKKTKGALICFRHLCRGRRCGANRIGFTLLPEDSFDIYFLLKYFQNTYRSSVTGIILQELFLSEILKWPLAVYKNTLKILLHFKNRSFYTSLFRCGPSCRSMLWDSNLLPCNNEAVIFSPWNVAFSC